MYGFSKLDFCLSVIAWLQLAGAGLALLAGSQSIVAIGLAGASLTTFAAIAFNRRQRQGVWKELLRKTPIYAELLGRFPQARIEHIRD
jgi:hypothetical protein